MIEEIMRNLYKLEIPLPGNPLKATNSYVIKNSERNLIIDTGMNREECVNAMNSDLRKLEVDLSKTDFFITHFHVDHLGLASNLARETSIVYISQPDADWITSGPHWDDMINYTSLNGFPINELEEVLNSHPGIKYKSKGYPPFKILKDGNTISAGKYLFKCVSTPGHSKGRMCLYELNKGFLVAGDHILSDITPTIQLRSHGENPLKEYLASLAKLEELDIRLVLPGHRDIFINCKDRIQAIKDHHQKRTNEVLSILAKGSKNAYLVASQMSWDVPYDSWDLFPILQKWYATGEAIAHLKYLEEKEMIRKEMREQNILFSLNLK